jgi:hypothetical protein
MAIMRLTLKITSIIFFILFHKLCIAQTQPDAGMWNTISIEKEISKKFSAGIDEELRLRDNFAQLNLLYTNFGASYKPIKGVKLSLIYRLIEKYEGTNITFSFRDRLMFDASYKYKLNNWSISYRSRIQAEVRNYYTSRLGKIPEWFWRNKFELKYAINKKFEPYIGAEFRYQIKDPRNPYSDDGWHRLRKFAGIDYNIDNNNSVGIYYLIQTEFGVTNPQNLYILGLQYSLTLQRAKKQQKEE